MRWRPLLLLSLAAALLSGCVTAPSDRDGRQATASIATPATVYPPHVRKVPPKLLQDEAPPDDLWTRLRSGFELEASRDHEAVQRWIDYYAARRRSLTIIMARAEPFLWRIVESVDARGMPMEVALLPAVESAFDPRARSRRSAAGLWQFIPVTAMRFGLSRDWWYDGRHDIFDSTRAALDYLDYLVKKFDGNWLYALAAYNAGGGRVRRAIRANRAQGRPIDFWHLPLPAETRAYVPKLLAISAIVDHPERYAVQLPEMPNERRLELVELGHQIDLSLAADLAGMSTEALRKLNPGYRRWATVPDGPHQLLIPRDRVDRFLSQLAQVPDSRLVTWQRHVVSSGDTLSEIADRYDSSVTLLKNVNHLSGNLIRIGQALLIPADGSADAAIASAPAPVERETLRYTVQPGDNLWILARRYDTSIAQLARWNGLSEDAILQPGQELLVRPSGAGQTVYYQVQQGDSLSVIAQRYGVSTADLRRWNDIGDGSVIHPGQRLRVRLETPTATASRG